MPKSVVDLCHPHLSQGREQFLYHPRHNCVPVSLLVLSQPCGPPTPSLLSTALSFWDCHVNGTTFLVAVESPSQVKTDTTIFKERQAGSWKGREASVMTAISLQSRYWPWGNKLLHEHLGCSNTNCQKWGETQIFSSTGLGPYVVHWLRGLLLAPQWTAKELLGPPHCSRLSWGWLWVKESGPTFSHPSLSNAGRLGSEGQDAKGFIRDRGKIPSETGLFDPLSHTPLPCFNTKEDAGGSALDGMRDQRKRNHCPRRLKAKECTQSQVRLDCVPGTSTLHVLTTMCWNLDADEEVYK